MKEAKTKTKITKSKKKDFRKLSMDQVSDQLHKKIHTLETSFLDTDDLLWEVNHKAYQGDAKIMKKVKDDLKNNFSDLRKKVIDISKLMKNYIDSDVITENVAVKFMKYMSKKHKKKSQNEHDISLTEVLDFLNKQSKMRKMKDNEMQVFKNAEMLNSFLLNKHFEFNNDDSASELYKKSKNSFEKTVKNAIGLSNFISSFGQIISSKLLNKKEMASIKAEPRKTKDVSSKKNTNKSISFELYQIPSKNQNNLISPENTKTSLNSADRTLKTNSSNSKAALDSGLKPSKEKKGGNEEDEDFMPNLKDLIKKRQKIIQKDEKRFSHKKISFRISDEEKQKKKQTQIKLEEQTPQIVEDIDQNGVTEIETNDDHMNSADQTSVINESATTENASHLEEAQDLQSHSVHNDDLVETQSEMTHDDDTLNPSHFSLDKSEHSLEEQVSHHSGHDQNSLHSASPHSEISTDKGDNLEVDKNIHVDLPAHLLDVQEGDYDENDPHEIQELDKEEARLKRLEKLGYPKVEKIDLEVKHPLNSYGLHSMSLTSSVKKFDGNPDASNAYHTLNSIMSRPVQEIKEEYKETQKHVEEADPSDVEMIDTTPHMNTYGDNLDDNQDRKKERKMSLMNNGLSYQQFNNNYIPPMRYNQPRNLRQMSLNMVPYTPLKRNYSDKGMFSRKSFLPSKELTQKRRSRPVPRNLLQNTRKFRHANHKDLRQKTDEIYDNMLKMRF